MQGFNMGRYVPPDLEGTTSANKASGKGHALGSRASKLSSQGILTVRFEMPFGVWCTSCPKPTVIGQGVRFNAEKKRVGNYYSTPIWSFRMRHAACGGAIEIRTDPKTTSYMVTEGGKKKDTGEDKVLEGDFVIQTAEEREALRGNAFAKLEKTIEDREQLVLAKARIEELEDVNARLWEDPYERNRRLRKEFRVGRHAREREEKTAEELKDKMSLGIDLIPASEEDARRAALVDFGQIDGDGLGSKALTKPLFAREANRAQKLSVKGKNRLNSKISAASEMRETLVSEIVGNTRAAQDPFLVQEQPPKAPMRIPGIKRKRDLADEPGSSRADVTENKVAAENPAINVTAPAALVDYDSNSE
ncbi:CWC16 protein [Pseudomassariella vexata]|uniref:CWC16 protein n=1 Tax=Pseudomassariella vexata TaxID=1141098 RepID=A0A1Y2DTI3_9PEZI|nr:CWC16 protein [Pseudomassariella vexata]ORY62592.1 CWC16 protein [Pseudomassariella vexata]